MLKLALHNREISYEEIAIKAALKATGHTVGSRLVEKHLHKWIAKEREYLDEETAGKRLGWALNHRD